MGSHRAAGTYKFNSNNFMGKEEPLLFVIQNAATMSL